MHENAVLNQATPTSGIYVFQAMWTCKGLQRCCARDLAGGITPHTLSHHWPASAPTSTCTRPWLRAPTPCSTRTAKAQHGARAASGQSAGMSCKPQRKRSVLGQPLTMRRITPASPPPRQQPPWTPSDRLRVSLSQSIASRRPRVSSSCRSAGGCHSAQPAISRQSLLGVAILKLL